MSDGDLQHHKSQLIDEISHRAAGYSHVLSPWSADGHPDHEACGEAVHIALRGRYGVKHWQYPIWAWHWADPGSSDLPWDRLVRFDIGGAAKCAKEDALGCYQSQIKSLSDLLGDEAVLGPHVLSHFQRDFEVVITEPNEPSAGEGAYFDVRSTRPRLTLGAWRNASTRSASGISLWPACRDSVFDARFERAAPRVC